MDKGPLSIHQVKLVVKPVDLEIQTLALIKESSIFVGRYKIRNGYILFLYIKKDKVYVLNLAHASFMAVVLERQQTALEAKMLLMSWIRIWFGGGTCELLQNLRLALLLEAGS